MTIDNPTFINIPTATVATDDKVLIQDTSDSDATKTVTAQSIADLASGSSPAGSSGAIQYNNAGAFGGDTATTDGSGNLTATTLSAFGLTTSTLTPSGASADNFINMIGTSSTNRWMRHRIGGSPQGNSGTVYSYFDTQHYFVTPSASGFLNFNYLGSSTATPPFASSTNIASLSSGGALSINGGFVLGSAGGTYTLRFRDASGSDNGRVQLSRDSSNNSRFQNTGTTSTHTVYNNQGNINFDLFNGSVQYTAFQIVGANGNCIVTNNISAANLTSGTYTPTQVEKSTNMTIDSIKSFHYIRVGNEVHVTGRLNITMSDSSSGFWGFTLPISSNFTNADTDLAGGVTSTIVGDMNAGSISASTSADCPYIFITASSAIDLQLGIYFSYTIK